MTDTNKFRRCIAGGLAGLLLTGSTLISPAAFGGEKNFTWNKKDETKTAQGNIPKDELFTKITKSYEYIEDELQKRLAEISIRTGYSKEEITEMGFKTLEDIGRLPTPENYNKANSSLNDDIRFKKETRDKIAPLADKLGNNDGETTFGEFRHTEEILILLENKKMLDYFFEDVNKRKTEIGYKKSFETENIEKQKKPLSLGEIADFASYFLFDVLLPSAAPSRDEFEQREMYREDNNVSHNSRGLY